MTTFTIEASDAISLLAAALFKPTTGAVAVALAAGTCFVSLELNEEPVVELVAVAVAALLLKFCAKVAATLGLADTVAAGAVGVGLLTGGAVATGGTGVGTLLKLGADGLMASATLTIACFFSGTAGGEIRTVEIASVLRSVIDLATASF